MPRTHAASRTKAPNWDRELPARSCLPSLIAMLFTAPLLAQDDYPILIYPCPKAEVAPAIDGALDDAAWESAPMVGGFTLYNEPTKVAVQTFVRAVWDSQALYLGVQCDEPMMDKVAPKTQPRDSKPIFADEAIEVFLDPDHDHERYYQFGINAAGSLFDGERNNPAWNGTTEVKATRGEASWTVEMAFPWADFVKRTPQPGKVVGLNVCRDRHVGGVREWTNWSQTKANFHDPVRFAHLVLSPTPQQLAKLDSEFRKGDRTGPIVVFSSEGFAETTYAQMAIEAFAKLDGLLATLKKTREQEQDEAAASMLADLIAEREAEIGELTTTVVGAEKIDAALWSRTDTEIQRILKELDNLIWEARLHALLSQI